MSDTVLVALIAAGVPATVSIITAVLQLRSKKLTNLLEENRQYFETRCKEVEKCMTEGQRKDELAITRVELMMLMTHDPENVMAIEKLARKYFDPNGLNGDSYMSKFYSKWAKKHDADYTFVTHL